MEFEWERGRSPAAFAAKLALFGKVLDQRLGEAMEKVVLMVEATAARLAPVDTGNLRASIVSEVRDDVRDRVAGYVGTNVEYAPFQEFGTSRMDAQPFLRPAIEAHRGQIRGEFRQAVDEAAIGAGVR